jgi:hypothetical protein
MSLEFSVHNMKQPKEDIVISRVATILKLRAFKPVLSTEISGAHMY